MMKSMKIILISIIQNEIGKVFLNVLLDAGVFKRTPEGQKAFDKFIEALWSKEVLKCQR